MKASKLTTLDEVLAATAAGSKLCLNGLSNDWSCTFSLFDIDRQFQQVDPGLLTDIEQRFDFIWEAGQLVSSATNKCKEFV